MEIIKHKIGETFCLEDGTKLEIAKSACNCRDCHFFNSKDKHCSKSKNIESCFPPTREDKEFIIFKQIKDNNMKEKRNIQISLEEAKEWYNSGDSFKRELALKAYNKNELYIDTYSNILTLLRNEVITNSANKAEVYKKLLNIAKYYNSIYPIEKDSKTHLPIYYTITAENKWTSFNKHKSLYLNKSVHTSEYEITFNSEEAAKKAIDILGNELNILFE